MTAPPEAVVSTAREIEAALASGASRMRVLGELAGVVPGAFLLRRHGAKTLVALGAALSAVRVPGLMGLSLARSIAALTGVEVALVRAVSALGPGVASLLSEGWEVEGEVTKTGETVLKRAKM